MVPADELAAPEGLASSLVRSTYAHNLLSSADFHRGPSPRRLLPLESPPPKAASWTWSSVSAYGFMQIGRPVDTDERSLVPVSPSLLASYRASPRFEVAPSAEFGPTFHLQDRSSTFPRIHRQASRVLGSPTEPSSEPAIYTSRTQPLGVAPVRTVA